MFTFTILVLPLSIAFYYIKSENKADLLTIITGVLTGAFIAALKAFFTFSHRIIPYSFWENFLYFFLQEAFVPMIILFAVFFLISRDTLEFKINSFFPLESSFYAIFLSYVILTSPQAKSIFSIFVKPILFLAMIYTISTCLKIIFTGEKKSVVKIIFASLIIIVYFLSPSIIETVWIMNLGNLIWSLASAIYICFPFLIRIILSLNKNEEE